MYDDAEKAFVSKAPKDFVGCGIFRVVFVVFSSSFSFPCLPLFCPARDPHEADSRPWSLTAHGGDGLGHTESTRRRSLRPLEQRHHSAQRQHGAQRAPRRFRGCLWRETWANWQRRVETVTVLSPSRPLSVGLSRVSAAIVRLALDLPLPR